MSFYDYSVKNAQNGDVSMKEYEGRVVLVVNTATGCGFTPQYKDIEALYEKYHGQGLEVLDIPCNQFRNQAPGTDAEIHEFCTLHYNTQFPQMKKSEVNGENELPLYTFLKSQKGFEGFGKGMQAVMMKAVTSGVDKSSPDIRWNFTKFVVDRSGKVVARFEPTAPMSEVEKCISSLL